MNFFASNSFSVKIAAKSDILIQSDVKGDVNIVWVFTCNSNRDGNWLEFFTITVLLALSLIVTLVGAFCAVKSKLPHQNHRLIVMMGILCWFELVISRYLVFLFQFTRGLTYFLFGEKMSKIEESNQKTSKILFWAAIFRYHYMFFGVHTLLSVTVERAMATVLLRDYEKKSRVYIPISLISLNFLVSLIYAFLACNQWIMMKFMFLNTLLTTILAMLLLEIIFFTNRRRLAEMGRHNRLVQYTLSIRYQLQENVSSCRLIRAAVITVGLLIVVIILTECLPVILNLPDDVRFWCNLIFDTMTHINALFVVPAVVLLIDGFRRVLIEHYRSIFVARAPAARRRKSIFGGGGSKVKQNEGDVYFEMFNRSVK